MARIIAIFMVAIPLSNFIGSPLSALLLNMDGVANFSGWQWLLMLEAIPAIILGLLALKVLPNGVVRRNPRNFRQPSSSPATSASRSMNLPSVWKV